MVKKEKNLPRIAVILCFICAAAAGKAYAADMLVPMGTAVGIQMNTDGVLVAETVSPEEGIPGPAEEAGIRPGDIIVSLAGCKTATAAELASIAAALPAENTEITVRRSDQTLHLSICPVCQNGSSKLGLLLRDGIAGVGTLTFYDPATGLFGALGHGIADSEGSAVLPLSGGSISPAQIVDVTPGRAGTPGALSGIFDLDAALGTIKSNTACGIFGSADAVLPGTGEAIPAADDSEICPGPAYILASVTGDGVDRYEVEISRGSASSQGRMLNVHVTDSRLLALTGGIVQGMSGSPIIQNGKLVGAVTHVLVSDPSRGYGISIQSMLSAARVQTLAA